MNSLSSLIRKSNKKLLYGIGAGLGVGIALASDQTYASGMTQPVLKHDFPHYGKYKSFDHASLRRGYEVYRQVCSTCHSLDLYSFRNLVGVTHTEEQAKALAQSYEIKDGPDASGEYYERPGKLSDRFPSPYPNEEYARYINNGALPPDLTLITKGRDDGEDYVYSLMMGYVDAPYGETVNVPQHWNSYFPGGKISMAKPLQDEGVEWEDGTYASVPQQAKDVAAFLASVAEPELDVRHRSGGSGLVGMVVLSAFGLYWKRFRWNPFKNRKVYRS